MLCNKVADADKLEALDRMRICSECKLTARLLCVCEYTHELICLKIHTVLGYSRAVDLAICADSLCAGETIVKHLIGDLNEEGILDLVRDSAECEGMRD